MSTSDRIAAAKADIAYEAVLIRTGTAKRLVEANGLSFDALTPRQQKETLEYAFTMSTGRWEINGDAIVLAKDGITILDGKRRLIAAAHFATCFPTLQVAGISTEASPTIGEHRKRTASVVLHVAGYDRAGSLATAATAATAIARTGRSEMRYGIPQVMIPAMVEEYPGIVDAVDAMRGTDLAKAVGHGNVAAIRFLADLSDPEASKEFFDDIAAAYAGEGSPLANGLKEAVEGADEMDAWVRRILRTNHMIAAWNLFQEGRAGVVPSFSPKLDAVATMHGVNKEQFDRFRPLATPLPLAASDEIVRLYEARVAENKVGLAVKAVTPEWAKERLALNGPLIAGERRNRKIAARVIAKYVRDMKAGRWQINGQTLKFGSGWELLDGQHRLLAVIESGVSIPALVAMGVDPGAFKTFDLGRPKRFVEVLKDENAPSPNDLQAAIRILWQHLFTGLGSGVAPTNSELLACWQENRSIADRLSVARVSNLATILPRSIGTAMLHILSMEDEDDAKRFFSALTTGADLNDDDPILALRQRLIAMKAGHGLRGERTKLLVIVKAWTAWREGRSLSIVKARLDEAFPGRYGKPAASE